ncbi:MAG TPA: hypothetical protein PK767_08430 [Clostridiales bacterium]|nr:hypothetical protein [Clostridiales bacterium]HOL92702.1 hypothetical protein [Clostridiales bacterium]HPP36251.1 hypothetical protein [Clostridiales bacterium]
MFCSTNKNNTLASQLKSETGDSFGVPEKNTRNSSQWTSPRANAP